MTALFARWYERLNDLWSAAVEAVEQKERM